MVLGRVKIMTTSSNPALTHFPSLPKAIIHQQHGDYKAYLKKISTTE